MTMDKETRRKFLMEEIKKSKNKDFTVKPVKLDDNDPVMRHIKKLRDVFNRMK